MKFNTATPYIASYVLLKKENKVLFVHRNNTGWMDGKYGLAAGKVENGESFIEAAVREAKEEAGVTIKPVNLRYILTVHRKEDEKTTWVDVFFEATEWTGKPYNAEPEVHTKIEWLDLNNLPKNIIPMLKFAFEQIKDGKTYAEYGWEN